MAMIRSILGGAGAARQVGQAVGGLAEVFVGNRAERDAAAAKTLEAAMNAHAAEFARAGTGRFDGFVDGLNRLPRPLLALSTLGLFAYAMAEPAGFSVRMRGLGLVPEPLWWLLGAVVSFYFGARELHHQRTRALGAAARTAALQAATAAVASPDAPAATPEPAEAEDAAAPPLALASRGRATAIDPDHNPAVEDWRRSRA